MKKGVFLLCLLFTISCGLMAQDLSLEQILNRYYQAANLEKHSKVSTIIMTGTIVQQDLMPVKIIRARPGKYLMEFDVADLTAYQATDGMTAWTTAPWTGKAEPQALPPDRTADLKVRADMDGILYNWKEKGHLPELTGTDTVNGKLAYKIKVVRKDGATEFNFIDCTDFLLTKRTYVRMAGGKEIPVEIYSRDYRKVDGIPFPFVTETNNGGRVNEIQFETIELDKPVDPGIFVMPAKK
jgi:hypothetical protein